MNLTEAIANKEKINWNRLEDKLVTLRHEDGTEIHGRLHPVNFSVVLHEKLQFPSSWTLSETIPGLDRYLRWAWTDSYGWTLHADRDVREQA